MDYDYWCMRTYLQFQFLIGRLEMAFTGSIWLLCIIVSIPHR